MRSPLYLLTVPFAVNTAENVSMSWLQFVDSMFGHLAWPLLVLVVVALFRKDLAGRIRNTRKAKFAGVEVEFNELLEKGAALITEAQLPAVSSSQGTTHKVELPESKSSQATEPGKATDEPEMGEAEMAFLENEISKSAAIIRKQYFDPVSETEILKEYSEIEQVIIKVADLLDVRTRDGRTVMEMLYARGWVRPELVDLFDTLGKAREEVARGRASPSQTEIREYIRQSHYLKIMLSFSLGELQREKGRK